MSSACERRVRAAVAVSVAPAGDAMASAQRRIRRQRDPRRTPVPPSPGHHLHAEQVGVPACALASIRTTTRSGSETACSIGGVGAGRRATFSRGSSRPTSRRSRARSRRRVRSIRASRTPAPAPRRRVRMSLLLRRRALPRRDLPGRDLLRADPLRTRLLIAAVAFALRDDLTGCARRRLAHRAAFSRFTPCAKRWTRHPAHVSANEVRSVARTAVFLLKEDCRGTDGWDAR